MYHTLSEGLCNYKCFVLGVQGYSLDLVLHLSQDASRSLTPLLHCLARGSIVGSCLVTSFLPSPHWSTIFTLSPAILAPLFEFLLQSLQPLHSCPHSILIKYLTPRGPKRTLRIVVFVVLLVVVVVVLLVGWREARPKGPTLPLFKPNIWPLFPPLKFVSFEF